jgi:prolyl oligopeptidase
MVAEQVRYTSKDGTSIPMFLLHKKDAAKDGKNRVQLYGYGGFNVSLTPGFSSSRAVWLERGGMIRDPQPARRRRVRRGLAQGRHGREEAERVRRLPSPRPLPHRSGLDLARAPGDLRRLERRPPGRRGDDPGPELFGAVVCAVPLLDMVRYHLFGSGATWIPEYGSADDPAQFKTLFAYSPYHHVVDGTRYPALLMLSADHDDRVDPMHARKFVAAIQHAIPGDRPAWLRIEKNAGHGGADAVKQAVEQSADLFAFLERELQ